MERLNVSGRVFLRSLRSTKTTAHVITNQGEEQALGTGERGEGGKYGCEQETPRGEFAQKGQERTQDQHRKQRHLHAACGSPGKGAVGGDQGAAPESRSLPS